MGIGDWGFGGWGCGGGAQDPEPTTKNTNQKKFYI